MYYVISLTPLISTIYNKENQSHIRDSIICDLLGFREDEFLKKRIKEGVHMCKAIEDWMDEGIVTLIRNLSTSQNISIAQAMDMLLIPEADRERYMGQLS